MWPLLFSAAALAGPSKCEDGQRLTRSGSCCWHGQVWSQEHRACVGIPRRCPAGLSLRLGPPDLPRAAACADVPPLPYSTDWTQDIPGLPGRVDAWGADPRLGPSLQWGEPELSGAIAKHRVDAVLREARFELSACSDQARSQNPTATGLLRIRWRVDSDGNTHRVRVRQSTLHHRGARRCMVRTIRGLNFPAPQSRSPAVLTYSFLLGEYR